MHTHDVPEGMREGDASRKRFLQLVGGAGAVGALGLLVAACGGGDDTETTGTGAAAAPSTTDLEIVNYALTLEFLEAKFYKDVIASGVIEDKALAKTAELIGQNEDEHVEVLSATVEQLGGKPAEDPQGDFDDVISQGYEAVLLTAAMVENLGAAAYLGAAPKIQSPDILAAALSIHTVEARHAAALNNAAGIGFETGKDLEGSVPDGAFAVGMDMDAVLKVVQPFLPKSAK